MTNEMGISHVIATVLLIAILVSGSTVTYYFIIEYANTRTSKMERGLLSYDNFNLRAIDGIIEINIYLRNIGRRDLILDHIYVDEKRCKHIEGLDGISEELYEISQNLTEISYEIGGDVGERLREISSEVEKIGSILQGINLFTFNLYELAGQLYDISINLKNTAYEYNKPEVSERIIYRANQAKDIADSLHFMAITGWTFCEINGNVIESRSLKSGETRLLLIYSNKSSTKSQLIKIICDDGTMLSISVRK
ncbi:MAG: hypothetical protein N3D12_02745 [Candidatus Methanomethyliaceae archaeon]|nr:hypothetical protein [Candidatus Methanomethyliaceae archaeon]